MNSKRINPRRQQRRRPASPGQATGQVSTRPGRLRSWRVLLLMCIAVVGALWAVRSVFFEPSESVSSLNPDIALEQAPTAAPLSNTPPETSAPAGGDEGGVVERVNRANQLLAQGQTDAAVQLLEEAAHLSPDDEDIHYNLGIALSRLGKDDEAVRAYQTALRIFPDYAEVHNNLGNLYLRLGRFEDALKHLGRAVEIMPDYAAAWNNRGNVLQQTGRTNEAQAHFKKAVELDSEYWQAHFNLGMNYMRENRFDEARDSFATVLQLQPGFPQATAALERLKAMEAAAVPSSP